MRAAWWFLGVSMAVPSAGAFVGDVNDAGKFRRWMLNPVDPRVSATAVNTKTRSIIYHLDASGYSATNTAAELDAVRAAFDQWQGVPGTALQFEEGSPVTGTTDVNSQDGINTLFWTRTLAVNGGRENLSGVVALTYVASYSDNNAIADADTVFNAVQYKWFTDTTAGPSQNVFVEGIALHEIGHFLGLRHSPVGGATMLFSGEFGVNSQVGLSPDEISAARVLYGTTATLGTLGRITGSVRSGATPLLGAAVFVQDTHGNVIAGTLTRSDGTYEMGGLPPGSHVVRAAPLDPAGALNVLIRGRDISSTYASASTGFLPTADFPVALTAGGSGRIDLDVVSGQPMRIVRLIRPVPDLTVFASVDKPILVQPTGQTAYLGVFTDSAIEGPVQLTITGDGLTVGPTEVRPGVLGNLTLAAAQVTFSPEATSGLRSYRLAWGDAVAWAHGFLEILPPFPDVNADGLDDRFQRRYWSRFTSPTAAPGSDPDKDGFDNAWESATGSDPTNSLSARFEIVSVRLTAEGALVRAQTPTEGRFQLYRREVATGSEWTATGPVVKANGPETDFVDREATSPTRYYRVRTVP